MRYPLGTEIRFVVDGGWTGRRGRFRSDAKENRVSSWGNENVIKLTVNTLKTPNSTL